MPIEYIKGKLSTIRGNLVEAQLDFLKDEKGWTSDDSLDWSGMNPVSSSGMIYSELSSDSYFVDSTDLHLSTKDPYRCLTPFPSPYDILPL